MRLVTAVLAILCLLVSGSGPWNVLGSGAGVGMHLSAAVHTSILGASHLLPHLGHLAG